MDLIGKRNYFFVFSILIILAGLVTWFAKGGPNGGFKMDIQFEGGTVIQMQMKTDKFDMNKAIATVKKSIGKDATTQKSQTYNASEKNKNINLLLVNISNKSALNPTELSTVTDALNADYKDDVVAGSHPDVNFIEPTIGNEVRSNGVTAVIVSSILIILYIWIRFNVMSGLSAGVMAVLALLHDVLIMLSIYVFFSIPLNESFIAAALTVIGYSMNDTIIIYDRIRENSNMLRKTPIAELVNKSILQTLSRSINTVVTVLMCVIITFAFAAYYNIESMKEFTLPLVVGIASGCYSSIFIASPLWVVWKQSQEKGNINPAKA